MSAVECIHTVENVLGVEEGLQVEAGDDETFVVGVVEPKDALDNKEVLIGSVARSACKLEFFIFSIIIDYA